MKHLWDAFIDESSNGTLFQKQSFLAYHIDRKFINHSLLFYKNNTLVAVLSAALLIKQDKRIYYSHPGSSFGGFVINKKTSFEIINEIIKSLEEYLLKLNISSIVLILSPEKYWVNGDESLRYLLHWNSYKATENYISHYVSFNNSTPVSDLVSKRKKRYINKLTKENKITIKKGDNFNQFYALLIKSKESLGAIPTHSLEELKKLKKTFPHQIVLLSSTFNKKVVGGTLLFCINSDVCLVFYNVVDEKFKGTQLASLQLYNAMLFAQKNNYQILDFGVSHKPESLFPLSPKFSLINFKEQFGARGCLRAVYQKELDVK
tara:strand:- start:1217 stop:2173 length:957 start_codon:yes stop_codon:yes gene_type:complete